MAKTLVRRDCCKSNSTVWKAWSAASGATLASMFLIGSKARDEEAKLKHDEGD
jgi:hypothetical protein